MSGVCYRSRSQGLSRVLPRDHKACSLIAGLWECLELGPSIDNLCHL